MSEQNRKRARRWIETDCDECIGGASLCESCIKSLAALLDAVEAEAREADEAFMYRALQWVERGGKGPNFTDPLQCMSAAEWGRLQRIAAAPPPKETP